MDKETIEIKAGMEVIFSPTGSTIILAKVTEKRISWWISEPTKSSYGKNVMRMTWVSRNLFQKAIEAGTYIIKK